MATRAALAPPATPLRPNAIDALGWLVLVGLAAGSIALLAAAGMAHVTAEYARPEYSHGWLIPLVSLYIAWQRRDWVAAWADRGSWLGVALVGLGILLALLGVVTAFHRMQAVALPILLGGLGLATLGRRGMRPLWVPLAFLLFALPLPGGIYSPLSLGLQLLSSRLGASLLHLLGISVYLDGNVIDLGVYKLQVVEACDGLRYLFPLSAFGFLCAWLFRAPLWARAVVLLATVPITILTNSARIALTGLLVDRGNIALAEGFLHLFEGWVIFLVALAMLLGVMWLLMRLAGSGHRLAEMVDFDRLAGAAHAGPAAHGLGTRPPVAAIAATGLLIGAALGQLLIEARPEMVPARPGLATFPLRLDGWQGRAAALDRETLDALGLDPAHFDDYLLADYVDGDGPGVNLWVAYYGSQRGSGMIHTPDNCLPGAGWEFGERAEIPAPHRDGAAPSFLINRIVATHGEERALIYYWLEQHGRRFTDNAPVKWYAIWDLLTMGRTDGALVRLITPIGKGETVEQADERLRAFFAAAYPRLEPHVGL